jgi:hypothetical protein
MAAVEFTHCSATLLALMRDLGLQEIASGENIFAAGRATVKLW